MSHLLLRRIGMQGIGLGDAPTWSKAQTDLTNQVVAPIQAGDQYLAEVATTFDAGYYNDAVVTYKAAGDAAAIGVGPEIDQCGRPDVTQHYTQLAWQKNQQLAQIHSLPAGTDHSIAGGSTLSDAQNAQTLVKQIADFLQQAINNGQAQATASASSGQAAPAAPATDAPEALATAGTALVNRLASDCPTVPFAECTTFQNAWNAAGGSTNIPSLTVDGKYGSSTQAALQTLYDATGGGSAPTNCFKQPAQTTPKPKPLPSSSTTPAAQGTTPSSTTTTTTSTAAATSTNWGTIAVAAAAGVGAGVLVWHLYLQRRGSSLARAL